MHWIDGMEQHAATMLSTMLGLGAWNDMFPNAIYDAREELKFLLPTRPMPCEYGLTGRRMYTRNEYERYAKSKTYHESVPSILID